MRIIKDGERGIVMICEGCHNKFFFSPDETFSFLYGSKFIPLLSSECPSCSKKNSFKVLMQNAERNEFIRLAAKDGCKYVMLPISTSFRGKTLYQIESTKVFSMVNFSMVNIGQRGGFIENERNMQENGLSWILDDSLVADNAKILSCAVVVNHSKVYGNSCVTGNSMIFKSHVFGDTFVNNAYIEDSIIADECFIRNTRILNSIVCKNVVIKNMRRVVNSKIATPINTTNENGKETIVDYHDEFDFSKYNISK